MSTVVVPDIVARVAPVAPPDDIAVVDLAEPCRVCILSAGMGAGHDGAAYELARRLEAQGHIVEVRDFLDCWPLGLGRFIRWCYEGMIKHAPWSYEAIYRLWYLLPFLYGPLVALDTVLARPRLRRWLRRFNPDVVVSTYPLVSLVLGKMRRKGALDVPVATYITDFQAHPLWTHDGVDLHLCVHDRATAIATRRVSGAVRSCAPLVPERFHQVGELRLAKRAQWGFSSDERAVLVVAGSWGVGDVDKTVGDLTALGTVTPVVVCGRNTALADRLERTFPAIRVVRWTDDMAGLMAAVDVLVDNAGGLTSMEALAAGLPIVNYRPLAGHGRENANEMAAAGVVRLAHNRAELQVAFDDLCGATPFRRQQIAAGKAMYRVDATDQVLQLAADGGVPLAPVVLLQARRRRRTRRGLGAVAVSVTLASVGLTTGVGVAAAHGIGGPHPAASDAHTYLGVRITGAELENPQVRQILMKLPVTVIVDGRTAVAHSNELHALMGAGIEIANGGCGKHDPGWMPWSRAQEDLQNAGMQLQQSTGKPARLFLPSRRLDSFDLVYSRRTHQEALPTAAVLTKPGDDQARIDDAGVFILDGRKQNPSAFASRLQTDEHLLSVDHIQALPLAHLV